MITISNLVSVLKTKFPAYKFYNGCINKKEQCIGVYARGTAPPTVAIGVSSSYRILPVTILVHWSENSDSCEQIANELYEGLENNGISTINSKRVIQIQMLDSAPVEIGRDDNNICEMTIRFNLFYER